MDWHLVKHVVVIAAIVAGALCLVNVLIFFVPHFWLRPDRGGDGRKGLVIWVEPLRFANIRWGQRSAAAGLRRAGYQGEFLYWEWHTGLMGTLLLPALRNKRLIGRQARELAEYIVAARAVEPERPIVLMGYSAGGFVAARALELLPAGAEVDSAALLSSAVSPWRDLRPACRAVRGRLLVSASVGDCWVLGAGTTLFGNADGVHSPGLGMLGYLGPPDGKIVQVHWRPRMLRQGLLGLHDWSMLPAFIAGAAAGILGLAATARKERTSSAPAG